MNANITRFMHDPAMVATHEASHAVFAHLVGLTVCRVRLFKRPRLRGGNLLDAEVTLDPAPAYMVQEKIGPDRVLFTPLGFLAIGAHMLAGPIGERVGHLAARNLFNDMGDAGEISDALSILAAPVAFAAGGGIETADAVRLDHTFRTVACGVVERLAFAHLHQIEKVARTLLTRRSLTRSDVQKLLREASCIHPAIIWQRMASALGLPPMPAETPDWYRARIVALPGGNQ